MATALLDTQNFIDVAASGAPALRASLSFAEVLSSASLIVNSSFQETESFIEVLATNLPLEQGSLSFVDVLTSARPAKFGHINNPLLV